MPHALPLRAVLFDLDGVLVDSYRVWFHVMNGVAARLGYPAISEEAFHAGWGQGVQEDVERFFHRLTIPELEREYDAEYPRHLEHLKVDPAAAPVLTTLHQRGLRTALVTNTPAPLARTILDHCGLELQEVVGGTDAPRAKPAPDMVLLACERLGVGAAEAVMVGDSRYDREAAQGAGVRFVGLGIAGDERIGALGDLTKSLLLG